MALDTTLVVAALTLGRIILMLALLIVAVFATLVMRALTDAILVLLLVVVVRPEESRQFFLLLVFIFILGFRGAAVGLVAVFTRAAISIAIALTLVVTLFGKEFGQLILVSPLLGGPVFIILRSSSGTVNRTFAEAVGEINILFESVTPSAVHITPKVVPFAAR